MLYPLSYGGRGSKSGLEKPGKTEPEHLLMLPGIAH